MLRRVALPVLFALALTGCGSTATESSQTDDSSTAAATTTTTTPAQPKTLEAATAAAQEWADRRAAGDYAGVWLLFDKQVRDGLSQADYVTLSETCTSSLTALPTTVIGVRRVDEVERRLVLAWAGLLRHGTLYKAVFRPAVLRANGDGAGTATGSAGTACATPTPACASRRACRCLR